ncbi:leucyl/phenylalanyl-tRNA--protein transferase [Motilimonas eburnea]|uniref:leucyl/phenylalanyl-tRNA--protein transferase n=1 Tax=Motilimonas eburnea TaxID=1737488 RepID=UPI001EE62422|nr:leucyl/phenylalanyl-tRNA--protein transferase [Motilimonas eburnea]MCE2573195.1 leucyl/phenylalanyl-tRNA--protein transferase [Motilimonas eburnea]
MSQHQAFPSPSHALTNPDGLLAVGGDLSPQRLIMAYRQGIFPWFSQDEPIMWWSPSTRATLPPQQVHIGRTMQRVIRQDKFEITVNLAFNQVIAACADERASTGTWITYGMQSAYCELHRLGHAHSVEVWQQGNLVGGIYGIGLGQLFCGESMFHRVTNASKIAFIALCQHFAKHGGALIDAQIPNPHLTSLGVGSQPRAEFLAQAKKLSEQAIGAGCWTRQNISLNRK